MTTFHCCATCPHCGAEMAIHYAGPANEVKVECFSCHREFKVRVEKVEEESKNAASA
jgi:hypothetical protein